MRRKWRQQDAKEERKHQREKHVQLVAAMASNLRFVTAPGERVKLAIAILKEAKKQVK